MRVVKINALVETPPEGRVGGYDCSNNNKDSSKRQQRALDAAKAQMEATIGRLVAKVKQHGVNIGNG